MSDAGKPPTLAGMSAMSKLPRKRERSTTAAELTLALPSTLLAKIAASAKASVRTPQQQAVYILLRHYKMLDGQHTAGSSDRDERL